MSGPEAEVERFFARATHCPAAAVEALRADILNVVTALKLSARVAQWGDSNQTKLCIYGSLPFAWKMKDCVVPLQIWLGSQYPIEPPTLYVVPTGEEKIMANSKVVDGMGLCYCPALAQWCPAKASLRPVLAQLAKLFSQFPPLWVDDTATEQSSAADSPSKGAATQSSDFDEDADKCVICLSAKKDTAVLPCGHCFCSSCASSVQKCPVCRVVITMRYHVFF